jgi:E3 ubiquitin-protein ligase DOA10
VVVVVASMTTIVVISGCFLLLFHPYIALVQLHQGLFFLKEGNGKNVGSTKKVIIKAMMLLLNLSLAWIFCNTQMKPS